MVDQPDIFDAEKKLAYFGRLDRVVRAVGPERIADLAAGRLALEAVALNYKQAMEATMFKLAIEKQDDGTWAAYDDNRYDGEVESLSIGRGDTEDEALEDLAEAMEFNEEGSKLIRDVIAVQRKGRTSPTLNAIAMTDEERSGVEKIVTWLDACGWKTEARNVRGAAGMAQKFGSAPAHERV